jgi:hypothetical protein
MMLFAARWASQRVVNKEIAEIGDVASDAGRDGNVRSGTPHHHHVRWLAHGLVVGHWKQEALGECDHCASEHNPFDEADPSTNRKRQANGLPQKKREHGKPHT